MNVLDKRSEEILQFMIDYDKINSGAEITTDMILKKFPNTSRFDITQSLLFTYYDVSIKNDIKRILNEWESYNAIKRTKYKNSYMIELL